MIKPRFLTGFSKLIFYIRLIAHVTYRYCGEVVQGRLGFRDYILLSYRLILLLKVMIRNKVVQIGDLYKLQLYLPAYPSPAFWESINKFLRRDPGPLTVVLSMTKACGYKCPHCYQRNDSGADLDIGLLTKVARDMQEIGVTMFDIEGGEPLLQFDRLMELVRSFDDKREIWVNTTGHLVTPERAKSMKEAGVFGVMISLHTPNPEEYDMFTGFKNSFATAREAARMFNEAGITVALNSCPTPELVGKKGIERIMDIAKEWECSYVQIIHGKSAGAWLGKQDEMIQARDKIRDLCRLHILYNSPNHLAGHPSASVQVFEEAPHHFGCTAGGIDRFYLNANGEVQPCEFLNVSFGNVNTEDFKTIFARMRGFFRKPGTRWLCASEARSIHRAITENALEKTPVPCNITETLVSTWDKGSPTSLYDNMYLYK
ncbi:MAG: radical SAM protein [Candidatus Riflebacteria bacterium]|nr:radical SAM protein [Candidatus Riflebacteria bacterium]